MRLLLEDKIYVILLANQIKRCDINSQCFSYQKEANKTYNCENLGLREIPDTLPNMTEFLEFGFNFLPTIENTTFSRLTDLIFLDLTRYVFEFLVCSWCFTKVITQIVFKLFPGTSLGAQGWSTYPACLFFPVKYFCVGEM